MSVILYSTGCPKCKVLKAKLQQNNIEYVEVSDVAIMKEKGFEYVPVLEIDGVAHSFKDAVEWIGGQ